MNLKDLARSGHVTRWHMVRTQRQQTLAEHHYLVTMIARAMLQRIAIHEVPQADLLALLNYTLLHDTPELLLGDIPTPTKRKLVELLGGADPLAELEIIVSPEYRAAKEQINDTYLARVAKLADLADAIVFLSQEGMGSHASVVHQKLLSQFAEAVETAVHDYPSHQWQGAYSVLDEMLDGPDGQIDFE